jgi:hypothetical protein
MQFGYSGFSFIQPDTFVSWPLVLEYQRTPEGRTGTIGLEASVLNNCNVKEVL